MGVYDEEMIVEQVVNSIFSSNTFMLHEEGGLDYWLVDIGDVDPVLGLLPEGAQVRGVFVTHSHFDHIYGVNALAERFPGCVVYASEHGREGLYSVKLNFSRYHGEPLVYRGENVRVLREGDRVALWPGCEAEVFETPGHDWSCLTYRVGDAVFCGDSYLPGVAVYARFPKCDKVQAAASERRILELARGRVLYPGHGEVVEGRLCCGDE